MKLPAAKTLIARWVLTGVSTTVGQFFAGAVAGSATHRPTFEAAIDTEAQLAMGSDRSLRGGSRAQEAVLYEGWCGSHPWVQRRFDRPSIMQDGMFDVPASRQWVQVALLSCCSSCSNRSRRRSWGSSGKSSRLVRAGLPNELIADLDNYPTSEFLNVGTDVASSRA
ncbi:hypothetical protein BURKHO8Y_20003 [Burkholderia sp. 8Y]|nr:hypothetical protein BURKHO8Y_20003 [Burkholderia sp. 8Y]